MLNEIDYEVVTVIPTKPVRHTHYYIKSAFIRHVYAEELLAFRRGCPIANRKDELWRGCLFGMETCFFKMDKVLR